jgi:hypothetical protein
VVKERRGGRWRVLTECRRVIGLGTRIVLLLGALRGAAITIFIVAVVTFFSHMVSAITVVAEL